MNLAQIQTAVQNRGYSTDTSAAQIDIINSVYRELRSERQWWWLEKQDTSLLTTIGVGTVSHSTIADFLHPTAVRIQLPTNPYPQGVYDLTYMPPQEMRSNEHLWRDQGIPEYWSEQAGVFHFWPIPDQVYTVVVDYIRDPGDLVLTTDVPVFPAVYHDVLVWGAVAELTFRERDVFNNRTAMEVYQAKLEKMRKADSIRQRQSSRYVTRSGMYDSQNVRRGYGRY